MYVLSRPSSVFVVILVFMSDISNERSIAYGSLLTLKLSSEPKHDTKSKEAIARHKYTKGNFFISIKNVLFCKFLELHGLPCSSQNPYQITKISTIFGMMVKVSPNYGFL